MLVVTAGVPMRIGVNSGSLPKHLHELERESPHVGAATQGTVADLMREPVPPLRENTSFREIADRFLTMPNNFLPVVDGERWVGMLSMRDLMRVELSEQGDEIKLLHEYIQH